MSLHGRYVPTEILPLKKPPSTTNDNVKTSSDNISFYNCIGVQYFFFFTKGYKRYCVADSWTEPLKLAISSTSYHLNYCVIFSRFS